MSGARVIADAVRGWATANGGELNRLQVRELLRALDALAVADSEHAAVVRRLGGGVQ